MAEILRAAVTALALWLALPAVSHAAAAPVVKAGSDWSHLTPAQKELLAPFAADWNDFTEVRRLKWIGIADRFPKMTPTEQANVRDRMREWSALTPVERQQAREQYKKLRTVPPAERKQLEQKWREYEALPKEEKQALQAAPKLPPPKSASSSVTAPLTGVRPPKPVVVAPPTTKVRKEVPPKPVIRETPPAPVPVQSSPADQSAAPAAN